MDLINLALDRKWSMLSQHLTERYRDAKTPVECVEIEYLKSLGDVDKKMLGNLVVSLRTMPIRWINQFIIQGGLELLLSALEKRVQEYEEFYITALKSLMNNKLGLSAVLHMPRAINIIALSLQSPSVKTKA